VKDEIVIEVACATPDKQLVLEIVAADGTTISEAIEISQIQNEFPELDFQDCKVGIFGQQKTLDQSLINGDRVEIYRELLVDPKQARLNRAAASKRQRLRSGKENI
jgi:putative ubiquitin-RnfH superfamily antitoxin RatB of RatAB toxin-antitoxin module